MIRNMNSASVFFAATTTLAFPSIGHATQVQAATAPIENRVVIVSNAKARQDDEESDLDSFIALLEQDPDIAAGLAEARQWVGETSTSAQNTLRGYRLAAGLSQAKLAKLVGMKQPNISAIEAGKRVPDYVTASKIAAALGIRTEDVFAAI